MALNFINRLIRPREETTIPQEFSEFARNWADEFEEMTRIDRHIEGSDDWWNAPAPRTQAPAPRTQAPAPRTQAPAPRSQAPAPRDTVPGYGYSFSMRPFFSSYTPANTGTPAASTQVPSIPLRREWSSSSGISLQNMASPSWLSEFSSGDEGPSWVQGDIEAQHADWHSTMRRPSILENIATLATDHLYEAGLIGAVLAALAAGVYGYYTAEPEQLNEVIKSVEAEPENPSVLERASNFIQSLWATKPEARKVIKEVAHRQRAAQSQGLNDLGYGGSTTGQTNLGEPFWTSTPKRFGNNVVVTAPGRKAAKHNFKGTTIKRAAQPFTGEHTLEFRM